MTRAKTHTCKFMHIKNTFELPPFLSTHGESVRELIGESAGPNSAQHSLAFIEIAPGKSSLEHFHPVAEESYYILEGEARIVIEEEEYFMKPHDCVCIQKNQKHQIFNTEVNTLRFLAVCVPPWTKECSIFS